MFQVDVKWPQLLISVKAKCALLCHQARQEKEEDGSVLSSRSSTHASFLLLRMGWDTGSISWWVVRISANHFHHVAAIPTANMTFFSPFAWHLSPLSFIKRSFVSCRFRNIIITQSHGSVHILFLTSYLIMLKHFLVSLYLLRIYWYPKFLTNDRWIVSVAFLSPKIDTATSFWIHQYFPNAHFAGLSHSASQHALTCSCLDDAEQHKGQFLITPPPPLGSHRPGAPLPAPPAQPDPRAMANSCPGMCHNSWMSATAVLQEGTGPYLCCSPLHGIEKCSLRVRKSTRLNLPLFSHGYRWWVCARGGGIWDVLKRKGMESRPSPSPQGNAETKVALGSPWSLLSSSWCLAMPWKDGQLFWEKHECPKFHLSLCYSLLRWETLASSWAGSSLCHLYGELATDIQHQNTSKTSKGGKQKNFRHQFLGDSKDLHIFKRQVAPSTLP